MHFFFFLYSSQVSVMHSTSFKSDTVCTNSNLAISPFPCSLSLFRFPSLFSLSLDPWLSAIPSLSISLLLREGCGANQLALTKSMPLIFSWVFYYFMQPIESMRSGWTGQRQRTHIIRMRQKQDDTDVQQRRRTIPNHTHTQTHRHTHTHTHTRTHHSL